MTELTEKINHMVKYLSAEAGKYLTFQLEKDVYGLEILKVQEIIGMLDITVLPKTPEYIRGVINLRGKVIPVLDLRMKFEQEDIQDTEKTCTIVVEITQNGNTSTIGIIVDEVSEVLDIGNEQIESTPSMSNSNETQFISGAAKINDNVVILLDIERTLTNNDMAVLSQAA